MYVSAHHCDWVGNLQATLVTVIALVKLAHFLICCIIHFYSSLYVVFVVC